VVFFMISLDCLNVQLQRTNLKALCIRRRAWSVRDAMRILLLTMSANSQNPSAANTDSCTCRHRSHTEKGGWWDFLLEGMISRNHFLFPSL
jgi:hypothetical protein